MKPEAAYAAAGRQHAAAAGDGETAIVAFAGAISAAAWLWRHGGRRDDAPLDVVDDQLAADPIAAAAAAELPQWLKDDAERWMDAHFADIAATAETLLATAAVEPAEAPAVTAFALTHRQTGQRVALGNGCRVADAVICGALAEAKARRDLGLPGSAIELYMSLLMDPLVAVAAAELGAHRIGSLALWIDGGWNGIRQHAAAVDGVAQWEAAVLDGLSVSEPAAKIADVEAEAAE